MRDIVALPIDEIQTPDGVADLVVACVDDLQTKLRKLYEDVHAAAEEAGAPHSAHLALSAASQATASLAVVTLSLAMSGQGYSYLEAWPIVLVDIQQRMQDMIAQATAIAQSAPPRDRMS